MRSSCSQTTGGLAVATWGRVTPVQSAPPAMGYPQASEMNAYAPSALQQPEKQRARWPVFLGLAFVLVLIALLLWWLFG